MAEQLSAHHFLRPFGGVRGVVDSSLPATVFVIARFFLDGLNGPVAIAVLTGLVVVALRRSRGQSTQEAFSGFFGLLIAVAVVKGTGSGKGIFLPGIAITAVSGVVFLVSLLVRQPLIGVGLTAVDPKYAQWRTYAPLRRAVFLSTAIWCVSFFIRAAVATTIYLAVEDSAQDNGVILLVINLVKWPLIVGSALATVYLVRQAEVPELPEVAESPSSSA